MATRTPRKKQAAVRTAAPQPATAAAAGTWPADWMRQQMAFAGTAAGTLFASLGAVRRIHEDAGRQAGERHAAAAQRLRMAASPAELFVLQFALAGDEVAAASRYWQDLAGAALEAQTGLVACGAQLVDSEDFFAPLSPRLLHC